MQKYNTTSELWVPNPDGKYAYGGSCVSKCPDHMLKNAGVCVEYCPINKTVVHGECVQCNVHCPKTCPGSDITGIVNSLNVEDFRGCNIIEGSLEISNDSFNANQRMHPDRLEVFSTLREVTGGLFIRGYHPEFTNLSYFRNLERIGVMYINDLFVSLVITRTSLRSLGLKSLKRINGGSVYIYYNENLCFAEGINWKKITTSALIN